MEGKNVLNAAGPTHFVEPSNAEEGVAGDVILKAMTTPNIGI